MAKLTAREELVTLGASICIALVLVAIVAGMTLANTVHQTNPTANSQVTGLASGSAKAPA